MTDKPFDIYKRLSNNIQTVVKGKDDIIRHMLGAFFCGGHVLLEDVPGTGKTTLAKSVAKSVGTKFKRVQFTPDLLPSDILGVSIFNQKDNNFLFHEGPVFTSILLADEINRASPRTQSALLEAMGEKQVSIEGQQHILNSLFFVIATENPIESHGTYPLPESQMDRFMVKLKPGYLDRDTEVKVISDQFSHHPLDSLTSAISEDDVAFVKSAISKIQVSEELRYYIVDIVNGTRQAEHISVGSSVRGSLALTKISQALAMFAGRSFVIPEDIIEAAIPVIAHRIQLLPQAKFSGLTREAVVKKIINDTPLPQ